jgi:hypothetical protein
MDDIPPWSEAAKAIKPGIYRHFKGDEYQLVRVARHSETGEEMVVYQSLKYPDRVWARPLTMFLEDVRRASYEGPRFLWVRET